MIIRPPYQGIRLDIPRNEVGETQAYDLMNFLMREGNFTSRPGYGKLGGVLGDRVNGLISYDHHLGSRVMVASTLAKWWTWDVSAMAWDDITPSALSGVVGVPQAFRTFSKNNVTYLLGVNGHTDTPKKWDGVAATFSDWTGSPPKAKTMAILANRVLLGNIHDGDVRPSTIDVSSFNDFEAGWGTTQKVILGDTGGDIVAIVEMGNVAAAVYKTDCIYMVIASDSIYPFRFDLKQTGIFGPANASCIVPIPKGHLYLSSDLDVYMFDGFKAYRINPAAYALLRKYAGINQDQLKRAFGFYNSFDREVWFCFCSVNSSEPDMGMVIRADDDFSIWPVSFGGFNPTVGCLNLVEYGQSIGDLGLSIGSYEVPIGDFGGSSAAGMLGSVGGYVYQVSGNSDDGTGIPLRCETALQLIGEGSYVDVHKSDHLFNKTMSSQNVNISFGISRDGEEPASYAQERTFDIGNAGPYCSGYRSLAGRMISMRMTATSTNPIVWRCSRVDGLRRGK